jgi:hypothetical protein
VGQGFGQLRRSRRRRGRYWLVTTASLLQLLKGGENPDQRLLKSTNIDRVFVRFAQTKKEPREKLFGYILYLLNFDNFFTDVKGSH